MNLQSTTYTSPAFQFYASDFLSDENVITMSLAARGAYITLLCHAWKAGSIPADSKRIAKLCGCHEVEMAELWQELSCCFVSHPSLPDRLVNRRMEEERNKQIERVAERTKAGKKGADTRWSGKTPVNVVDVKQADSTAIAKLSQTHSTATDLPLAKNSLSSSSSSSISTSSSKEGMADAPPAPGSKHAAVEAYRRVNLRYPAAEDMQKIIDAVGDDVETYAEALNDWRAKAQEHNAKPHAKKWNPAGVDAGLNQYLERKAEQGFNAQAGSSEADIYYGPPIA